MTLVEVFSHSDRFHYRANIFSCATVFVIICACLTLLPPFLWAYFAGGFWIKESLYYEQARVDSAMKYLIIVGQEGSANAKYFATSYSMFYKDFRNALLISSSTATLSDSNGDGVFDQITFNVDVLFADPRTNLDNIKILLMFQYELRGRQHITMESMGLIELQSPSSGLNLESSSISATVVGDLVFQQRQPIQSSGFDNSYAGSILDSNDFYQGSSMNLNKTLQNYYRRKFFTSFKTRSVTWARTLATNTLTLKVVLNNREQSIRFIPGFWQEFKWGWIQYLSFLLPFVFVFNRFKEIVFRNQVFHVKVEKPLYQRAK